MSKIVHPICCGIDVHKKFLVAAIAITDKQNVTTYIKRRFSTFNSDLKNLEKWLHNHNCTEVCMESTGKYWIPIFNVLENSCHVVIANPKYVRAIKGKKTDDKDATWIADLFKFGLVPSSFIPPKEIRRLRELFRYRFKLTGHRASEKNRLQNALTVSNIALASVVSDSFGKSASAIVDYILSCDTFDPEHCKSLLQKKLKEKADEIIQSIIGYELSNDQSVKMKVCTKHYDYINECVDDLDKTISSMAEPYTDFINYAVTIPGISKNSATYIIAEIDTDMSVFKSSKHLCSWAGLTPQNNESAGKKKSVRISRAGVYLKPLLVQCANAAIKDKKNPYFKIKYDHIKKRRGHKRAIIAIARMILTCIYHMFLNKEAFNPSDTNYSDIPEGLYKKLKMQFIKNAIKLLEKEGCVITPPAASA
ncbi:IS110 family transposase [Serpentinicella alkaliphila]|uniref:Transposase n=1 Tax=Serpentinicella alkaliphila TaxID=1734049 RepID=A0A4R2TVU7_9FIRM|nr:IS110 family transposase [Serpentinicella alkaliphila]QUH26816.1 IS110 family transposase [Serpentinicella alkaliphila]TCQ08041.1 transposase [Serpentinicella alkaliphila]